MPNIFHKAWRRGRSFLPVDGFAFGRPIVVLQSDDWGRVGVRDRECWEQLRASGLNLGERTYDFYSLETAEDVAATVSLLQKHRDSSGRAASIGMNFILANVDCEKVSTNHFQNIYLLPLAESLPEGWQRPGLFQSYQEGISLGSLSPAFHGVTHFCRRAVERYLKDPGERGVLLRNLWNAGVPYIHWRMPWVGFEYWDPQAKEQEGFLSSIEQEALIVSGVKSFRQFFSKPPRSACAPGYRADRGTYDAWAKCGIQVAQNGPASARAPHFDMNGILHLYRSLDFEPAVLPDFSVEACVKLAEHHIARGLPAIVSVHSINFHSAIKDFRTRTLRLLDEFLTALEAKHPDILYLRDEELYDLVDKGTLQSTESSVRVPVTKRKFTPRWIAAGRRA